MGYYLPDPDLCHLPLDNLEPEKFELIMPPFFAWAHIDSEYVFDDRWSAGVQLINMQRRAFNGYTHQSPPHGPRERERLKRMVYSGEVVMLERFNSTPGSLFYIDGDGALICRDPQAFSFNGAANVIHEYQRAVACRDYRRQGGRPRPTKLPVRITTASAPPNTINSKMAGRLLAAGGIYHQNPEMFAETARLLGGSAAAGFDEVLNEKTIGSLTALRSVFSAGRASVNPTSITELKKLESFLGRYKGSHALLNNIDVVKMDYVKRSSAELKILRSSFNSTIRKNFAKSIADHPDVINRLSVSQRDFLQSGLIPKGYSVHHKLPLDDTGTNDFSNLVLIKNTTAHSVLTTTQNAISRGMASGEHKTVLWPVPRGVIYP